MQQPSDDTSNRKTTEIAKIIMETTRPRERLFSIWLSSPPRQNSAAPSYCHRRRRRPAPVASGSQGASLETAASGPGMRRLNMASASLGAGTPRSHREQAIQASRPRHILFENNFHRGGEEKEEQGRRGRVDQGVPTSSSTSVSLLAGGSPSALHSQKRLLCLLIAVRRVTVGSPCRLPKPGLLQSWFPEPPQPPLYENRGNLQDLYLSPSILAVPSAPTAESQPTGTRGWLLRLQALLTFASLYNQNFRHATYTSYPLIIPPPRPTPPGRRRLLPPPLRFPRSSGEGEGNMRSTCWQSRIPTCNVQCSARRR